MSKDSLNSDLESLERMVVDFSRDNGVTDPVELGKVVEKVQRGDLTTVLKKYEEELKHPITNAIVGDLLRALLIQGKSQNAVIL